MSILPIPIRRVFGVGVDLTFVSRFVEIRKKHGDPFLFNFAKKFLHPEEVEVFHSRFKQSGVDEKVNAANASAFSYLAGRWAAKESIVKAAGIRLKFPEIQIRQDGKSSDPRPKVAFDGDALKWADGNRIIPHLSISHDGASVIAYCTLESVETLGLKRKADVETSKESTKEKAKEDENKAEEK